MKTGSFLIGHALPVARLLVAPGEEQLEGRRESERFLAGTHAASRPIADLATGSSFARLSFSRTVTTLQVWRGNTDVRYSTALIDPDALATRVAVAEAFARLFSVPAFTCCDEVATFATWLPPPIPPIRSS